MNNKMNRSRIFRIGIITVMAVLLVSFTDRYYFKINKSFDIFGSLFKEITNNYVLEVDPELLIQNGIEGMLNSLDPYSIYYTEEDTEEIELITDGNYVGFGITVGFLDSMLTIVDIHEGFPAHENGLRIGDRIYMVDSARVLNQSTDYLRQFTRGKPGEIVNVQILRDGLEDTLAYILPRAQIKVEDVTYAALLENDIAYIKLEHFSRKSSDEFLNSLNKIKSKTDSLRGLIIDVRDNPGGLLSAAVSICEYFVPEGSKIVSTKGRKSEDGFQDGFTYRSLTKPIEPDLPIAVLINGNSASASEILAGAIQDLDRGVIIGRRSFGKGLVQSVYDLPYNNSLKLTTAKYYTPSGRCIQRLNFAEKYGDPQVEISKDTNVFYTNNGRKVFEMTGIQPDTTIGKKEYPDIVLDLMRKNIVFNFSNRYTSNLDYIDENFTCDEQLFAEFTDFIFTEYLEGITKNDEYISEIKKIAEKNKYSKETIAQIDKLEKSMVEEEKKQIEENYDVISEILEIEIIRRFYPQSYMIKRSLIEDENIITAVNLLSTSKYNEILSIEIKNSNDKQ